MTLYAYLSTMHISCTYPIRIIIIVAFLQGLELEDLICLDELDLQALADSCALQALVLTDHNLLGACVTSKLRGGAAAAEGLVQGIVDHHQDQGAYLGSCPAGASSRVIAFDSGTNMATAGSACTLVAELMLQAAAAAAPPTPAGPAASAALQDVAILLQGVICIDTQNMDACGVGTARDASALGALEEKVAGKVERNATFTLLRDAKSDPLFWDGLNALECMCIDYKQFTQVSGAEVGIASTLLPIMQFLEKEDSCAQMAQYISCPTLEGSISEAGAEAAATTIKPLEMLLVMSTVYTPEFRRELLLASFDEERVDALATFLQAQGNSIRLQPLPLPIPVSDAAAKAVHGLHLRVFHQGNAKASRKQIAPLVQKFYGSA